MSICIVVGNGPSLARENLKLMSELPSIAFNHSYCAWESIGLNPSYYACFDPLALEDAHTDISRLIKTRPEMTFFLAASARKLGFEATPNLHIFNLQTDVEISANLNRVADLGSVAASSIPVLKTFGYSKFILLGIDARYSATLKGKSAGKGLIRLEEDPDHFIPEYGVGKRRKIVPDLKFMLDGWRRLAEAQAKLSIEIINASTDSALTCFPRFTLKDALKSLL